MHLFEDIHRIACAYHWSEREILGLTLARRRRYMSLLDAADTRELLGALGV